MKKQINEIKRMQLLAGLITESEYSKSLNETEAPSDIKNFLLGMMDSFSEGNDNEYPAGKHMEFKYEEEYGDEDLYGEKTAKLFNKAKLFLSKSGPVTIQDTFAGQPLDLTFSVDGGDIKMEWIEPATNESPLNEAENNEVYLLDFPEDLNDVKKYKKLGFEVEIDDPVNKIYSAKFDLKGNDASAAHNLLYSCKQDGVNPTLWFNGKSYSTDKGIAFLDQLASDDKYADGIGTSL